MMMTTTRVGVHDDAVVVPTNCSERTSESEHVVPSLRDGGVRTASTMVDMTEERWVQHPVLVHGEVPRRDIEEEGEEPVDGGDARPEGVCHDTDLRMVDNQHLAEGQVGYHDNEMGVDGGHFVGPFGGVAPGLNYVVLVLPTFGSTHGKILDDPAGMTDPPGDRTGYHEDRTEGSGGGVDNSTLGAHRIDDVDDRAVEVDLNNDHEGDGRVLAKGADDQYGTSLEDVEAMRRPTCHQSHTAKRTVSDGVGTETDGLPYDGQHSNQEGWDDDHTHPTRHDGDCACPSLPWDQIPPTDAEGLPMEERRHVCYSW
jgi:hypothetical protein